jgi:endonuclease III
MPIRERNKHSPSEFDLDVISGDDDMFRWFLLCFLFGKPIRSETAVATWRIFIDGKVDTPWAILETPNHKLVNMLRSGGYTRYQHAAADGLQKCMKQLIRDYDGSLYLMVESSMDEDELSKRIQKLYGVGPKIAEIFMREVDEIFARRVE